MEFNFHIPIMLILGKNIFFGKITPIYHTPNDNKLEGKILVLITPSTAEIIKAKMRWHF